MAHQLVQFNITLPSLQDLIAEHPQSITKLKIMHSPSLRMLKGLHRFPAIQTLNLSSNSIENLQGLHILSSTLVEANLSCNCIRTLPSFQGMNSLRRLILSFNLIQDIAGLADIAKEGENQLQYLDLKSNKLADSRQLSYLGYLQSLSEMVVKGNPFTNNHYSYLNALRTMDNHSNLVKIDGLPLAQFQHGLQAQANRTQTNRAKEENSSSSQERQRFRKSMEESQGGQMRPTREGKTSGWVRQSKQESLVQIQDQLAQIKDAYLQLEYKKSLDDKYWQEKLMVIQKSLSHQRTDNQALRAKMAIAKKELSHYMNLVDQLKKDKDAVQETRGRREKDLDELYDQVRQLSGDNAILQKQIFAKAQRIEQQADRLREMQKQNYKIEALQKDNERRIAQYHAKALQANTSNALRHEDVARRYQQAMVDNKELSKKNIQLERSVRDMESKMANSMYDYQRRISDLQRQHEHELRELKNDHERAMQEAADLNLNELADRQQTYSRQIDNLEAQFKSTIREVTEKNKTLKLQLERVSTSQAEFKQALRAAQLRGTEQEGIVNQLQSNISKIRKQLLELMEAKEQALRAAQKDKARRSELQRQVTQQRDKMAYEVSLLERQLSDLKQKENAVSMQLERWRLKGKSSIALEERLEDLMATIETKNQMLEDKNDTIQNYKSQLDALRGAQLQRKDSVEGLRRKYDKAKQHLHSTQEECARLRAQLEDIQAKLEEKNAQIQLIDQEFQDIRQQQTVLSEKLQDKEKENEELRQVLTQLKAVHEAKSHQLVDMQSQLRTYKEEAQTRMKRLEGKLDEAERGRERLESQSRRQAQFFQRQKAQLKSGFLQQMQQML